MTRAIYFLLTFLILLNHQCYGNSVEERIETVRVNLLQEILNNPYLRSPITMILDLDNKNVAQFKSLWFETAIQGLPDRNITLYTISDTYMTPPVQYSSAKFSGVLSSLNTRFSVDEENTSPPIMAAVLSGTYQMSYDSAIVIITRTKPSDSDLSNSVSENLIRKRARLYVIWTGEPDSKAEVLLDAAFLTGGAFYYAETNVVVRTRTLRYENDDLDQKIINRKKVIGRLESSFVVHDGVETFRIRIKGNLTRAVLIDPQGQTRDLLLSKHDGGIDLLVPNNHLPSGAWLLKTEGRNKQSYDVLVNKEIYDDSTESTTEDSVESISDDIEERLRRSLTEDQEIPKFERVSFPDVAEKNDTKIMMAKLGEQKSLGGTVPVIVELASGSNLEIFLGSSTTLQFEVTNNLNLPIDATFTGSANGAIIQNIQPNYANLLPSKTVKIQVTIAPLPQQNGGSGILKFDVITYGKITTRRANIYFTSETTSDTWNPKMTYEYKGDCKQHGEPATCSNGQWSVVATIKDEDSGLLKVLSEPFGLNFQSEFIAGTKSPAIVTYSETCCKPKVDIWAEDLRGNFKRKSFDVFHQGLLDGEITAIVVGVLFLLILILLIIVTVLYCKKRKSSRMVLPRHRANSK